MKHFHYSSLDSTQDKALELILENPDLDYLVVSVDKQLKGRGRHDKSWDSVDHALCMSIVLKPANTITLTSLELAVHICDFFNNDLKVKWPNDVFDKNNKKTAGILIDVKNNILIAGLGVNLTPNENYGNVGGINTSIEKLAHEFSLYIEHNRLTDLEISKKWQDYCMHMNGSVEIIDNQQSFFGIFSGIGLNGQAMILQENAKVMEFYSGSLKVIS